MHFIFIILGFVESISFVKLNDKLTEMVQLVVQHPLVSKESKWEFELKWITQSYSLD